MGLNHTDEKSGQDLEQTLLEQTVFVVVDLETAGSSPETAEIIEIGAIKLQGGEVLGSFESLLKPRGAIPTAISRITGIYPEDVAQAPPLEEVLPAFWSFIEGTVLVAHNAVFDRGFLEKAALRHLGHGLHNPDICTLRLARRLLPELPRKGLDALAIHFEVTNMARHRAMGDAQVTAHVLGELLAQAQKEEGAITLSDLLDLQQSRRGAFWQTIPAERLAALKGRPYPKAPGVYFMEDEAGQILYIGKAKNLKTRIQSYFHQGKGHTRKVLELMRQVHRIEYTELGSELDALLMEARLIKSHMPYYNRQIKNYKSLPFIKITVGDKFPRVEVVHQMDSERAVYFGPFTAKRKLSNALEELNRVFQLRTCSDAVFRKYSLSPCMLYDVQQCSGPCAGRISEAAYQEGVSHLMAFLQGEASAVSQRLVERRDQLAEGLRFEEAGLVQQQIFQLLNLQHRSRLLVQAVHESNCLIVLPDVSPGCFKVYVVLQGRPVGESVLSQGCPPEALEELLEQVETFRRELGQKSLVPKNFAYVPKEAFEETRIIANWLHQRDVEDTSAGFVIDLNTGSHEQLLRQLSRLLNTLPSESLFPTGT